LFLRQNSAVRASACATCVTAIKIGSRFWLGRTFGKKFAKKIGQGKKSKAQAFAKKFCFSLLTSLKIGRDEQKRRSEKGLEIWAARRRIYFSTAAQKRMFAARFGDLLFDSQKLKT